MRPLIRVGDKLQFKPNALVVDLLSQRPASQNARRVPKAPPEDWDEYFQLAGSTLQDYLDSPLISEQTKGKVAAKAAILFKHPPHTLVDALLVELQSLTEHIDEVLAPNPIKSGYINFRILGNKGIVQGFEVVCTTDLVLPRYGLSSTMPPRYPGDGSGEIADEFHPTVDALMTRLKELVETGQTTRRSA